MCSSLDVQGRRRALELWLRTEKKISRTRSGGWKVCRRRHGALREVLLVGEGLRYLGRRVESKRELLCGRIRELGELVASDSRWLRCEGRALCTTLLLLELAVVEKRLQSIFGALNLMNLADALSAAV
jgi:hypothetical protein